VINELRVAIKKADKGKFSSYINKNLKRGDLVEVLPPTGKFIQVFMNRIKRITWQLQQVAASRR
jgi:ferredoxin-NADP reductase